MKILNYSGLFYAAALAVFFAFFLGSAARYLLVVPPLSFIGSGQVRNNDVVARDTLALAVAERNIFDIEKMVPAPEKSTPSGQGGQSGGDGSDFDGRLTGIIVGTDGRDVRAIFLKTNKDVLVLKQGVALEGYKLESVEGEVAIVSYKGSDYTLELQDGLKTGVTPPAPPVRGAQPLRPQNNPPKTVSEGTENIVLNRADITGQLKDINKVITTLLASPAYQDKELVGYRIVRMQNESPVRQLGIQPGDIINRINGEELTNPQILFNMLQQAADISAISVDVTRNGVKKTLFVEIQ
ncbi:MAG: hypothetical protein LBD73_08620 [Deferribacteraceae bacterium]|jgi:general secretion pathway protein C|nr:hypothetical protein [Deferribacteraceae bacterium]